MHYNSRQRTNNNYHNRGGRGSNGAYVWRVSWMPLYGDVKHKSFSSKQQALIFITKLENNPNNICIELEKWDGSFMYGY